MLMRMKKLFILIMAMTMAVGVQADVLGDYTYDYFIYENANECGYGFSAHFFKKFVVLKSITTDRKTFECFGMGVAFDGVYIKQR